MCSRTAQGLTEFIQMNEPWAVRAQGLHAPGLYQSPFDNSPSQDQGVNCKRCGERLHLDGCSCWCTAVAQPAGAALAAGSLGGVLGVLRAHCLPLYNTYEFATPQLLDASCAVCFDLRMVHEFWITAAVVPWPAALLL